MPRETIDCPLYSVCYLCIRKTNHFYVRELLLGRYSHASAARRPTWHPQPAYRDRLSRQHRRQNFGRNPPLGCGACATRMARRNQGAATGSRRRSRAGLCDGHRQGSATDMARPPEGSGRRARPAADRTLREGLRRSEGHAERVPAAGHRTRLYQLRTARVATARQRLRSIPSDRLFLETDMSGEEIESVYRRAADIRNEPAESLRDAVHTNYLNLFGL